MPPTSSPLPSDIGFHAKTQSNANEILTPTFDSLAAEGVLLDRHYVFRFCSPTRSALLTGRNPIHVNVLNSDLAAANTSDPISGFAGLPRNISTVAEKLASVGYQTVQAGKVRHRYELLSVSSLLRIVSHARPPPPPGSGTLGLVSDVAGYVFVSLSLMCGRNRC